MHLNPCKTDFNLDIHAVKFLAECEFWAELSRNIKKVPTMDIPTMCVAYVPSTEEVTMFWNPKFVATLSDQYINSALKHEFSHVMFGHITSRVHMNGWIGNIAMDLSINSIIASAKKDNHDDLIHPSWFLPGRALKIEDKELPPDAVTAIMNQHNISKEEVLERSTQYIESMKHLSKLIEGLEPLRHADYYFEELRKDQQKFPDKYGMLAPYFGMGDVHDFWDSVPEHKRDYVKAKVRSYIEKAQRRADQQGQRGWGDISAEMQAAIRRMTNGTVDWRSVLRQFVGTLHRGDRRSSIKKINKRYSYIHPGVQRGRVASLLICVDQSGSVDDDQLTKFFAELVSLTTRIQVDILPFDCSADKKMIYTWRKGTVPEFKRVLTGGTNFDAPSDLVNSDALRGKYDGYIIMTDGEAPKPRSSRVKRAWVISKGHKPIFETDELIISLDEPDAMFGAWGT